MSRFAVPHVFSWKRGLMRRGFIIASDGNSITLAHSLALDMLSGNDKKGQMVCFSSLPLWTQSLSYRKSGKPMKSPCPSKDDLSQPWVIQTGKRTYAFTHTPLSCSPVYLSFESDQNLPRQIVSSGPMAKAFPNNLPWSENDGRWEAHLLSWELFVL